MPFLLLLVFTVASLQTPWPEFPLTWFGTAGIWALTWGTVAALAGWSALLSWRYQKKLRRPDVDRYLLIRQFSRRRTYHLYAQLTFFLIALYGFGWGVLIEPPHDPGTPPQESYPGAEILLLMPLLVSLLLSWVFFYDVERTSHDMALSYADEAFPSRRSFVLLQARSNLLLTLPLILLIFLQKSVMYFVPALNQRGNESLVMLLMAGLLGATFVGIPVVLRVVLGLKPLPEGPLRTRLLATARRLAFRCNDLLVWKTHNTVANAMVTGPLPFLRYVVFTDRLLDDMTEDEIEAVFGHEVGHVKHHHMVFYLVFLLGSLFALSGLWLLAQNGLAHLGLFSQPPENGPQEVGAWEMLATLPLLVVVGAYIFVVFGFLSRRCERQADIFGCRTVSCEVFISALEKVALLNGIHREKPGWLSSWQHSTIARRVEFLQHLQADPEIGSRFQWRVGLIKIGVLSILAGCLTGILLILGPSDVWAGLTGPDKARSGHGAPLGPGKTRT